MALRPSSGDSLVLRRCNREYWVQREGDGLVIRNAAGEELRGRVEAHGSEPRFNLSASHPQAGHPYVQALLKDAAMALGLAA